MPNVTDVLTEKYNDMEWSLSGSPTTEEEFEENFTVIKSNGNPRPKWSVIQTHLATIQADYDSKQYQRDRKKEYDKLNQFELIGEDSINGTTNHRDAIIAIKDKYPKE